ncbi:MAG: coaE 1 [Gammaproteobacteria bacterium]|jgi:dephospho-CoA kinase|nr:coaE 1 [Gammaproteobacteria bacterium]
MSEYAVGLIGGIGSGKSTVAELFAQLGVKLIDADIVAREMVLPNSQAMQEIAAHFGKTVLNPDNSLNRKALREIIFQDNGSRLWLENLLHPLIREQLVAEAKSAQSPYCMLVIPLLKSKTDYPILNRILAVDVPESIQIARVQLRDKVDEAQAKAIINAQMPRQERLKLADDIIINDGHIFDLEHQVKKLHQLYLNETSRD